MWPPDRSRCRYRVVLALHRNECPPHATARSSRAPSQTAFVPVSPGLRFLDDRCCESTQTRPLGLVLPLGLALRRSTTESPAFGPYLLSSRSGGACHPKGRSEAEEARFSAP